jgi:hypothetical protein
MKAVVIAEGQSRAVEFHDASAATLQHFHRLAHMHAELLQAMNFIRPANQLIDPSALAGWQHLKRKGIGHGGGFSGGRDSRAIAVETESHYAIDPQDRLQ